MISAIGNQGKLHFVFSQESVNQQKLIEFLERLIKDIRRKVCIILDKPMRMWEKAGIPV